MEGIDVITGAGASIEVMTSAMANVEVMIPAISARRSVHQGAAEEIR